MKKIFILTTVLFFYCNFLFAASITEELTQLNNLYKEGAITKEEFSKAKSLLLKSNISNDPQETKKVDKKDKNKKIDKKEKKKKLVETSKKDKKKTKITTNEDLTKSYMHIDELPQLGSFVSIKEAPIDMFETKSKHFSPKVKEAQEKMYMTFVQKKGLMEKYPENLFKAMGYFEFFYMEQLRKKQKNIAKFSETWPKISNSVRKDIKSLYSLNQARKTMRESLGLTLNDDVDVALERFMLMHNFLSQAKKETIKLTTEDKYLRKNSKKFNTSLSNIQKNAKLRKETRISEKEFKKNFQKEVKRAKIALKMLSKKGKNTNFYKTIDKAFIESIENYSDLEVLYESTIFITGIIKEVEKNIIPKKYKQNMENVSAENLPESEQTILAAVSISMKMQKDHKKNLFHNSMLNLSNNGIDVNKYVVEILGNGFDLKSVSMTFDEFEKMKLWASRDWAKSWKGKLPEEIKDTDGNIIEFTDQNIEDLKAQLAINTFNEMISFDQSELGGVNDSIREIAMEIKSSGGFNIKDFLNQDFSISLTNYSKLVGNNWGIDINDFKDLTRAVNEMDGTNMTPEEYSKHWESADHWGDSGLSWGDITRGVDLIDQVGSFEAATVLSELGASLQDVADTISQAAAIGVSTDLEAAAQGLGYGSFADAVAAYNAEHGTNYTVESAKEALGQ